MTCPRCSSPVLWTRGLEGLEPWCPAHGEVTLRREPTEADQPKNNRVPTMTLGNGVGKWWR